MANTTKKNNSGFSIFLFLFKLAFTLILIQTRDILKETRAPLLWVVHLFFVLLLLTFFSYLYIDLYIVEFAHTLWIQRWIEGKNRLLFIGLYLSLGDKFLDYEYNII